jgi:hypothetical protein
VIQENPTIVTQDKVWAAAIVAHRMNGGYVKRTNALGRVFGAKDDANKASNLTNVAIMRILLKGDQHELTEQDYEDGQKIRAYFCGLIHLVFGDGAKEFLKKAISASGENEFRMDSNAFPLIAALPDTYEKMQVREKAKELIESLKKDSIPLQPSITDGPFGTYVVTVVDVTRSKRFGDHVIHATTPNQDGYALVTFFDYGDWQVGETCTIMASLGAANNDDRLTYLNNVQRGR